MTPENAIEDRGLAAIDKICYYGQLRQLYNGDNGDKDMRRFMLAVGKGEL